MEVKGVHMIIRVSRDNVCTYTDLMHKNLCPLTVESMHILRMAQWNETNQGRVMLTIPFFCLQVRVL